MAVDTAKVVIPEQLTTDRVELGALNSIKQWTEGKRIEAVATLDLTVTNPPTQAEVQAIANKVDELIEKLRSDNSNILDV